MDDQKKGSECDIIQRIKSLANGSTGVSYQDFERLLKEVENVPISQWRQVVTFATDQLGFWMAEWLFSPVHRPNTAAEAQTDGWRLLNRVCTDELVKKVPEVREQLEKQQSMILLRNSLQRRIDYNRTRPLERLFAIVLSTTSIALNKLGFTGKAEKLYGRSLYPKGTVGRTRGLLKENA